MLRRREGAMWKPRENSPSVVDAALLTSIAGFTPQRRRKENPIFLGYTIKSIYVPLKSDELADTYNRHYWLHKTEFRLSQVRLVELDEKALIGELETKLLLSKSELGRLVVLDEKAFIVELNEDITDEMVSTKTYDSGMGSSIKRWFVNFYEDYAARCQVRHAVNEDFPDNLLDPLDVQTCLVTNYEESE
ncbi:hypothetical protein V1517DRAFT_337536 [Lipomyces orientalis]|uniref:Uncharacterized protein n=1 Tax=Lipomyces orientalis TaxID=1233043 RepID=A0ACC3TSU3_9ASCO